MAWDCPRCALALIDLTVGVGVTVGCQRCGGVWLDDMAFQHVREKVFARILEASPPTIPPLRCDRARLTCPECGASMSSTELAGVRLDYCPRHGTWFDPGELEAVCDSIMHAKARAIVGDAYAPQLVPSTALPVEVTSRELARSVDRLDMLVRLERERERDRYD
jgi:Zn-finger nucleic acid-binding protein